MRSGIHTRKQWWVEQFGLDTDFIAATQDAVERLDSIGGEA